MEALKLSITTIIFILLFIAPGAIFNFVVTRWVFATGRYNNSKITSVIVAIILSIAMIIALDRPYSKKMLNSITHSNVFSEYISDNKTLIESLSSKKIFDMTLKIFGESEPNTPKLVMINQSITQLEETSKVNNDIKSLNEENENTYFLVASGAFLIIFSFLSSILLSLCLKLIESIIKHSYINNSILYFSYFIKFISGKINLDFSFSYNLPNLPKWIKTSIDAIFAIILVLAIIVSAIIFFGLAILAMVILAFSIFATWLLQYSLYKVLNLFKHPFHENFFSYQLDYCTPIVEIRTNGDYLVKGIMQSFVPLNHQELYAITISNVVQYHLQNSSKSKHFSRKSRTMYEFENQESHLTIFMSNVQDINIWLLNSIKTSWKFEINSQEDIQNQLWYFRTLMDQNKLGFNVQNLDVKMNYKYAFLFMYEVAKSIDSEYKTGGIQNFLFLKQIHRIKKSELYFFILKNARLISKQIQNSTLSAAEVQELNKKKKELTDFIALARKR